MRCIRGRCNFSRPDSCRRLCESCGAPQTRFAIPANSVCLQIGSSREPQHRLKSQANRGRSGPASRRVARRPGQRAAPQTTETDYPQSPWKPCCSASPKMDDTCRNYKCSGAAERGSTFRVQSSKFSSAEDDMEFELRTLNLDEARGILGYRLLAGTSYISWQNCE